MGDEHRGDADGGEELLQQRGWLRSDNTRLEAVEAARRIADELGLPRA